MLLHFMSQTVPMEMSLVICFNGSRKEEWQHSFADIPALAYTLKKLLLSKTGTKRKKKKEIPEALSIHNKGRPFPEHAKI